MAAPTRGMATLGSRSGSHDHIAWIGSLKSVGADSAHDSATGRKAMAMNGMAPRGKAMCEPRRPDDRCWLVTVLSGRPGDRSRRSRRRMAAEPGPVVGHGMEMRH